MGTFKYCQLKNNCPISVVSLHLDSVRKNVLCVEATDVAIESVVKRWLHLAPDRDGGRKVRARRQEEVIICLLCNSLFIFHLESDTLLFPVFAFSSFLSRLSQMERTAEYTEQTEPLPLILPS